MKKKTRDIFIFLMIFIFMFPLVVVQADEAPSVSMPIVAAPSAELSQMETWARKNNATETFIDLAKLYWNLSKAHGGIDPVVAYAQSAKETKYGNFGGVIDASFNNPCGLKITEGGDDKDPNAHKRFETWEQGVKAHLDHLALYAGAEGYPRKDTFDPRHFPYIFGRVGNSVEKLGSNWAPSPTYGNEIVNMINNIKKTIPERPLDNKIWLDNPSKNIIYGNKDIYVSGWVLSPEGIKEVNVYVDNKLIGKANYGLARSDVNSTFPGYPDGENTGFSFNISSNNVGYGAHQIQVKAVGNKGNIIATSSNIDKVKLDAIMTIDIPENGKVIKDKEETISGWAISGAGIKEVQVYLDNKLIGLANYGVERKDVNNAYPKYENGSKVGFNYKLDTSLIKAATVVVKLKALSKDGETIEKNLTLKKEMLSSIDTPKYEKHVNGKDVTLSGWALNASGVKEAKLYINEVYIDNINYGLDSSEIRNIYPHYMGSEKAGFSYNILANKLKLGKNNIKLVFVGNDGSVEEKSKSLNIYQGENMLVIDTPTYKVNSSSMEVSGWTLNKSGVKNVEIYIDDKYIADANFGIDRPDVDGVYPGYPLGNKSGFNLNVNMDNYSIGEHSLKIKAIGKDGSTVIKVNSILIERLPNYMALDNVSNNQKFENYIELVGWALNQSKIKEVKVYLNDRQVGSAEYGITKRSDVNKVLPGYPSGDFSGYYFKFPLSGTSPGNYTLKLEAIGNDGLKSVVTRSIIIEKKAPISWIDSPNYTNIIDSSRINISGWALNTSGIKEIKVYVDNELKGTAQYGLLRKDVGSIFSFYPNASESGFLYLVNPGELTQGKHEIKLEIMGNDSTSETKTIALNIMDSNPRLWFEDIKNVTKDSDLFISGWALNKSGIKEIKVYIDGVYKGDGNYGISRPDVNQAYYGYPQGEKSGYSFNTSLKELSSGKHILKVTAISNDLKETNLEKQFSIEKLPMILNVDTDFTDYEIIRNRKQLPLSGWVVSDSHIEKIDIYLDGKCVGSTAANQNRPDVNKVYSNYPYSLNSGFVYNLNIEKLSAGTHTIQVNAIGTDKTNLSRTIHFKISKTIVLDAGHGGSDPGATGNGYKEKDLNIQIVQKLGEKLKGLGFNVLYTRQSSNDVYIDLSERVKFANDNNADLFLSIHHDSSTSNTANGTSTHYSTFRPGIETTDAYIDYNKNRYQVLYEKDGYLYYNDNGVIKSVSINNVTAYDATPSEAAVKSEILAETLVDELSGLGVANRDSRDHNLYVTRWTNMTSVLIEVGFISNPDEIAKIASASFQDQVAQKIADTVKAFLVN